MRNSLIPHPGFPCTAVSAIVVDVERPRLAELRLRYLLTGRLADVRVPVSTTPTRADELWKHTCFEAFVRGEGDTYFEFNFAPSTQWAAYVFAEYRTGMRAVEELSEVGSVIRSDRTQFELSVSLELDGLRNFPSHDEWRLGLSAVVEETNGRKSYWALAHPPGKPDFHHSDCFVLSLPSASRS